MFEIKNTSLIGCLLILCFATSLYAAPQADLWPRWQHSGEQTDPDYSKYQLFLNQYLHSHNGTTSIDYAKAKADLPMLEAILLSLQQVPVSQLRPLAQKAYWVNLYNVSTIAVVLRNYPVESIKNIRPSWYLSGPWAEKYLQVEGVELSLNDIEHRILRPVFKDARVHYAVNCASIGCPNLAATVYSSSNIEQLLNTQAQAFINHPRALRIKGNRLYLSSIYDWFSEDFIAPSNHAGNSRSKAQGLIEHFSLYANAALTKQLEDLLNRYSSGELKLEYHYNWQLNSH